jgi:histidinol dehydrogenase
LYRRGDKGEGMSLIRRLDVTVAGFDADLASLLAWDEVSDEAVVATVTGIVSDVKKRGDAAVLEYTNRFDRVSFTDFSELCVSKDAIAAALARLDAPTLDALQQAAKRIEDYHQHQYQASWQYTEDSGNVLGQKITPLARVGIYVPGGKASYPSSVLMNAIPAKVAGVKSISMVVPAPDGELNDMVLAAASIAGVDSIYTIGGAQAIAALAYGTETLKRVDKIVGPGNIFVATAKRMVFGQVGLDMIAGPSEILIICDGKTDPDWIAMDLFSQAEHDENAQSILISADADFLDAVEQSIARLLPTMQRQAIIAASLRDRGALILVENLQQAYGLSNTIAPEHLELSVADPDAALAAIEHAGAIFMGRYTAEALGDYCAGPNHVLPTSSTARFSSPLGVYDFQKRSSIIHCSQQGASDLGQLASVLSRGESLEAHARSAEYRILKP